MSQTTLELNTKLAVKGGAVEFVDTIAHPGQERVARFHAWTRERASEVELRVGDVGSAGDVTFDLVGLDSRSSATIVVRELERSRDTAGLGSSLDITFGQRIVLPGDRSLELTAIGRYGVQVLFTDRDGCQNYTRFDFGFWRDDGLLFEVESADRRERRVRLAIHPEDAVNRPVAAKFGEAVTLGPRDVATYPDGATLRLRRAERQCYDAIDWRLLAHDGDDVSYPYVGAADSSGQPTADAERDFGLAGRSYSTSIEEMALTPTPQLTLRVDRESSRTLALHQRALVHVNERYESPDGLRLTYRGSAHGHGTSMGPDGTMVPMTSAWADFGVVKGGVSRGFTVDLIEFDEPVTELIFGYSITVIEVDESSAVVRVDGTSTEDLGFDDDPASFDVEWTDDPAG